MRKVKSAPANLCELSHNKKISKSTDISTAIVLANSNLNIDDNNEEKENSFRINVLNKKRMTTINAALITDTYYELSKKLPYLDNYYINGAIDVINSFITNKFNRHNLENLIISLIIRFIFSTACHDIMFKMNEVHQIDYTNIINCNNIINAINCIIR